MHISDLIKQLGSVFIIGIDSSTGSTTGIGLKVIDGECSWIPKIAIAHDLLVDDEVQAEQDPEAIDEELIEVIKAIQVHNRKDLPVIITFSIQQHKLIFRNGSPISNAILWCDSRSSVCAEEIRQIFEWDVPFGLVGSKLVYFARKTDMLERAKHIDYGGSNLTRCLLGEAYVHVSEASAQGWKFCVDTLEYDNDQLNRISDGIVSMFPEVLPAGEFCPGPSVG